MILKCFSLVLCPQLLATSPFLSSIISVLKYCVPPLLPRPFSAEMPPRLSSVLMSLFVVYPSLPCQPALLALQLSPVIALLAPRFIAASVVLLPEAVKHAQPA